MKNAKRINTMLEQLNKSFFKAFEEAHANASERNREWREEHNSSYYVGHAYIDGWEVRVDEGGWHIESMPTAAQRDWSAVRRFIKAYSGSRLYSLLPAIAGSPLKEGLLYGRCIVGPEIWTAC